MGSRRSWKLDHGRLSLLLPILVVVSAVVGETLLDFVGVINRPWFVLIFLGGACLLGVISIVLAIYSFISKQSIVFGIIGIVISLPLLILTGDLLFQMIIIQMIASEPTTFPRLH